MRLMHEQALGDDLADGEARRQRAERVLENQLQFAPKPAVALQIELFRSFALEADRPGAGHQLQKRPPERRLSEPDSPTIPIVWPDGA
jgi:plasmid stabilization system protein ParE